MTNKKRYTKEEIDFIIENYPKYGSKYCGEKLGKSAACINCKANSLNIYLTKIEKKNIHIKARERDFDYYDLNPEVFINVKTPESAYILGYLWADGTIRCGEKSGYSISLEINRDDFNNIRKTAFFLGKWNIYYRQRDTGRPLANINIYIKPLAVYLSTKDYLIKSLSNFNKILSTIPDNLKHYWWRGYFDGDGCIHINKKIGGTLSLSGTYQQDWDSVINLFKELDIKSYSITKRINKKDHKSSVVTCQNRKDILKFLEYIYENRNIDKVGLDRKYNKFQTLLEKIPACETRYNEGNKMWVISEPIWVLTGEKYDNSGKNHPNFGKFGKNSRSSKSIKQIDKVTGEILKIWECVKECAESLKINRSCISAVCKKRQKTAGGFKWEYV